MPPFKLSILAQIAKEAGDWVLSQQADIVANKKWTLKEDGSPVTHADIGSDRRVYEQLKQHFPHIPVLSEEDIGKEGAQALQANERFAVDALDNTRAYIKGGDGFSVNIGHIKDGESKAGAIYFSAKKELYFTNEEGTKAYMQKGDEEPREIHVKNLPLRSPLKVAISPIMRNTEYLGEREYETEPLPAQYSLCAVAKGDFDITGVKTGFKIWDIAGPRAVLRAAGGELVYADGQTIRYGSEQKVEGYISGGTDTLKALGLIDKSIKSDRNLQ